MNKQVRSKYTIDENGYIHYEGQLTPSTKIVENGYHLIGKSEKELTLFRVERIIIEDNCIVSEITNNNSTKYLLSDRWKMNYQPGYVVYDVDHDGFNDIVECIIMHMAQKAKDLSKLLDNDMSIKEKIKSLYTS